MPKEGVRTLYRSGLPLICRRVVKVLLYVFVVFSMANQRKLCIFALLIFYN